MLKKKKTYFTYSLFLYYLFIFKIIIFIYINISFCEGGNNGAAYIIVDIFMGTLILLTGFVCFSRFFKEDDALEHRDNQFMTSLRELQEQFEKANIPADKTIEEWANTLLSSETDKYSKIETSILEYLSQSISCPDLIKTYLIDLTVILVKMQSASLKYQEANLCCIVVAITFFVYLMHVFYQYDLYVKVIAYYQQFKVFLGIIIEKTIGLFKN
jgi:hypothetical protein